MKSPVLQQLEPSKIVNQKECTADKNGKDEDIKEVYSDPEPEKVHKEDNSRSQQFNLELLQKKTSKRRIRGSRLSSYHYFH